MKIAITGAFSYSGQYIARRLLRRGEEVTTLTGHPGRPDPFDGRVRAYPLDFDDPGQLRESLRGAQVLVNTYWIRFDRGRNTQIRAVENTRALIDAASRVGVHRVVHISITSPSVDSHLPYFRGKAAVEKLVLNADLPYTILRPTVLFGTEDILINNIAFLMRRLPLMLIPGDGSYRLQPVYVDDLAALAEEAIYRADSYHVDTVGPETFRFDELVRLVGRTVGRPRPLVPVPPRVALCAARVLGLVLGDVLLTPEEIDGLMASLLVSAGPVLCPTRLSTWLEENKSSIGVHYASEVKRHYG